MHVTGGISRGYKIKAPKIHDLRMIPYSVKESIFDYLSSRVRNSVVLDLFAGSGALGIESLSRHASQVDFVDIQEPCVIIITESLRKLNYLGRGSVFFSSAEKFIEKTITKYDLIFLTPPYSKPHLYIFSRLSKILTEHGLVIFEHSPNQNLSNPLISKFFKIDKTFRIGWSCVGILSQT